MTSEVFNIATLLTSLQFILSSCFTAERYEIVIYQKMEPRNSSLSCLFCYNGDATNDCMTLRNVSAIPIQVCTVDEPVCKVRRLEIDGKLQTFDRYCAKQCDPGCREGGLYVECESCCNQKSLCNTDNSAHSYTHSRHLGWLLGLVVIHNLLMHLSVKH